MFTHKPRTVSPEITLQQAERIDRALFDAALIFANSGRGTFGKGLPGGAGCPMAPASLQHDMATKLLQLPLRHGGCGLPHVARTADAAYLGSLALVGQAAASINNNNCCSDCTLPSS